MEISEKDIGNTIIAIAERFNDELMQETENELEGHWYFEWNEKDSLEWNLYQFYDKLKLYGNVCRRWEEAKNGTCCVVERVRDKYLMPKIREFAKQITSNPRAED